jgi:hypothetical protein
MRDVGLPVPPMHDRGTAGRGSNIQAGFITALVLPMWASLADPVLSGVLCVDEVLGGIRGNLSRHLQDIEDSAKQQRTEDEEEHEEVGEGNG